MRAYRLVALPLLFLSAAPRSAFSSGPKPNDATLSAKPPEGAIVLFDGKSLDGWVKADRKTPAAWPVEDGLFAFGKKQGSILTTRTFGDVQLHIEFNVPYMPDAKGQARGNSGVYLAGSYELQILDSYGLKPQDNDCGAIYKQVVPLVNACKPPLQWQTYDITFHKAEVAGGKLVKKARITVVQNGIKIIDNAEISPTPGGVDTKEGEDGPLLLQDHGNDVQFRNIWARPL
jgi:hypothetical protein